MGIASEQAGKNATRLNGRKHCTKGEGDRIAALEEQVRALSVKNKVDKDIKCKDHSTLQINVREQGWSTMIVGKWVISEELKFVRKKLLRGEKGRKSGQCNIKKTKWRALKKTLTATLNLPTGSRRK